MKGGICKAHGAKRLCMIVGCGLSLFQEKMCQFHYGCAKGKSGSDWDPTITRVMGMDMLGFEVLAYLGMAKNNKVRFVLTAHGMMCLLFQGCVNHGGKHLLITSTGSNGR